MLLPQYLSLVCLSLYFTCFVLINSVFLFNFNFRSSSGNEPRDERRVGAGRDKRRARNHGVGRDKQRVRSCGAGQGGTGRAVDKEAAGRASSGGRVAAGEKGRPGMGGISGGKEP